MEIFNDLETNKESFFDVKRKVKSEPKQVIAEIAYLASKYETVKKSYLIWFKS